MRWEAARRRLGRICSTALDPLTLRMEVARAVLEVVPAEGHSFSTTDPDTGLLSHGVGEGLDPAFVHGYMEEAYPTEYVHDALARIRTGQAVSDRSSPLVQELLRGAGYGHALHALFSTPDGVWGSWCLMRGGSSPFTDDEVRFLEAVAPTVARGLRRAMGVGASLGDMDTGTPEARPGVLILGPGGEERLRTRDASRYLADLADENVPGPGLPMAVRSALLPGRGEAGDVRARGRSGRWYRVGAAPGECEGADTVVLLDPLTPREMLPLLARAYGLTAREREVLALLVRGTPAKRVAAALSIGVNTAEEHISNVYAKVGVRGRMGLVARILEAGPPPLPPSLPPRYSPFVPPGGG